MISLAKYKKLSYNFKKPFVVHKGIRYTLSTREGEEYKVIEQGIDELYELVNYELKQQRKQQRKTTKNYHTMEEVLGVNPKHKQITCNTTLCKSVESISKEGNLEAQHYKRFMNKKVDALIPHQVRVNTIIKHIAKDTKNQFTTDISGNLVKVGN